MRDMRAEHLDHLVIVAGICRESGLAEHLDALTEASQQQVSAGTATVAMILNGLAFSNCRLNLANLEPRGVPVPPLRPIATT